MREALRQLEDREFYRELEEPIYLESGGDTNNTGERDLNQKTSPIYHRTRYAQGEEILFATQNT